MIQGTTPTHTFDIPFDTALINKMRILYAQNNKLVLEKENADCSIDGNTITVRLTQEDTLKFVADALVQIQLRILTAGGDALASDIVNVDCRRILDDEVL